MPLARALARSNGAGFQPLHPPCDGTWGVAPGYYGARRWRFGALRDAQRVEPVRGGLATRSAQRRCILSPTRSAQRRCILSGTHDRPNGATPRPIVAWGNAPGIAAEPARAEGPAHAVGPCPWPMPLARALARCDGAGFQPLHSSTNQPGALPQATMGRAVGASERGASAVGASRARLALSDTARAERGQGARKIDPRLS